MSKLYIFGIGGTGSRVLRALTMLLASGIECKANTIVPIIIDPDAAAADLTRTVELMKKYGQVYNKVKTDKSRENKFFITEIKQTTTNFRLPLSNTDDKQFSQYIDLPGLNPANRALAKMLFSQKNLESDFKVGFKGNPNIGSVVLNQFDDSIEFKNFANDFDVNDKIFIVSSIFGGTGASGFPLLLKTLRTNKDIPKHDFINKAHIGAITILPYFNLKSNEENSEIDAGTFVSKTKSALAYYDRSISKNRASGVDSFYYIADNVRTAYANVEGGANQKNDAHFVELASALAILDFAASDKPDVPIHKEYGIENETNSIIFSDLCAGTQSQIKKSFTQFLLFTKYLKENKVDNFQRQPWFKDHFDHKFFSSEFVKNVLNIQDDFYLWLQELENQTRKFTPFELNTGSKLLELVKGLKHKTGWFAPKFGYGDFDLSLNKINTEGEKEQQLVEMFYQATQILVKDKFNIE